MTDFTREQLARITQKFSAVGEYYTDDERDLAAFALALLDRAEKAEELTKDKDRTLAQAIKSHLREVDKRKQAEAISAGNLARAEKAETERDEANDERDDAVARWSRRAREAEAACKELLQVQIEQDRLREENKSLREANEIDLGEKAPLIFENAELKARNEILREELRDAEEAIRYVAHGDGYDCYRSESSPEPRGVVGYTGVGGVWFAFPEKMQPAVRRALKQKE